MNNPGRVEGYFYATFYYFWISGMNNPGRVEGYLHGRIFNLDLTNLNLLPTIYPSLS